MRRTILIVDDEFLIREIVTQALRDAGHAVLAVATPAAALDWIRGGGRADLLLTDIRMPGMSGVALADLARRADPSLRILFMTGFADELAILDLNRVPLVLKPFRIDQLCAEVATLLERHDPAARASQPA